MLWVKEGALCSRLAGELDQAGEGAFVNIENGEDVGYEGWRRIV